MLEDAPDVQRLAGAFDIARTFVAIPHPYPEELAIDWISRHLERFIHNEEVHFAITRKREATLVGAIGFRINAEHSHGELGYWIGVPFWGEGYATEAVSAMVSYGFSGLSLHRIYARHMSSNPASARVLEKSGLKYEGTLREHLRRWGVYHDIRVWSILATEYKPG